ncbi:Fanconi anemia group I protein-like isoform X2 [Apostichopus japonicus]|uniref:Fanconi anemia group I protein-like isoform X2 n=1 Tax=Stichopus japonicus TaxID=307972 RepID=UPI003AB1ED99
MEKKIIQLYDADQKDKLQDIIKELTEDQISEMLNGYAGTDSSDGASLLNGLFAGATTSEKKDLIYKVTFKIIRDGIPTGMLAGELSGTLMVQTDFVSSSTLIESVDCFTEALTSKDDVGQRTFDVLPKILENLASKKSISHENNHMTGVEFKRYILNKLCSGRWESHHAVPLVTMFKDIEMSEEEVSFVIDKILRMLEKVDLQVLPGVICQLLILACKCPKKNTLYEICSCLASLDEKYKDQEDVETDGVIASDTSETFRQTVATIVTHITFVVEYEQTQEFLKILKAGQQSNHKLILSPFVFSLALALAHSFNRLEEPILDVLKTTIFRSFRDAEKIKKCQWMSGLVPEPCDVTTFLCELAQRDFSKTGLEQVGYRMVQLAFLLMESYGPKTGPFGKIPGRPVSSDGANQQTCNLAIRILKHLFEGSESFQLGILERTLSNFLINMSGISTHYVDLFHALVKTAPLTILSNLGKLSNTLDYLSMFQIQTSEGILNALTPLMKINVNLKDSLMLILRKAMFGRQLESRKIAVLGYMKILRHFQVLGSLPMSQPWSQGNVSLSSQQQTTAVEVHNGGNRQPANYTALVCTEILWNLSRSLTQQAEVRRTLYQGLYGVVHHNSKLLVPVLMLLVKQLDIYVDPDEDAEPPMRLEPTIVTQGEKVDIVEPLGDLIQSLVHCTMRAKKVQTARAADMIDDVDEEEEDGDTLEEAVEEATAKLTSLRNRLVKSEMEDFRLDKSADFSTTSPVGKNNTYLAMQLQHVFDAILEFTLTEDALSMEAADQILKLFTQRSQLQSIMMDKGNQGNSKNTKSSKKSVPSQISLHCLSHFSNCLFGDPFSNQEAALKLKDDTSLCHFLVSSSLDKLRAIRDGTEDALIGTKERLFQAVCVLARVFLDQINTSLYGKTQVVGKQKATSTLAIEGLELATVIICDQFKMKISDYLQELEPSIADQHQISPHNSIHIFMKKLQRMFIDILTTESDDRVISLKDSVSFCGIFGALAKELDVDSEQFTQMHSWTTKVCSDHTIDDPVLAKRLLSLQWDLTICVKSGGSLIRSMSQDLHSQVGDIDQEVEVEDKTHFAIVNNKTSHQCILLVLSWSDYLVDKIVWLLNKKTASNSGLPRNEKATEDEENEDLEKFEKVICHQLGFLLNSFHELTQTAVPVGLPLSNTVKSLVKLYDVLTIFCKYFLSLYVGHTGHFSERYEKLVKLSGTQLTQSIYPFITYVQTTQAEKLSSIPKQKSKKKGAKPSGKTGGGDSAFLMKGKAGVVMREGKLIPNLIYAIENYEKFVIRLAKKSKTNLLQDFKLSTCRDFRINSAAVEAAFNESGSESENSDGEDNEDQDNEDQENQQPKTKKRKK